MYIYMYMWRIPLADGKPLGFLCPPERLPTAQGPRIQEVRDVPPGIGDSIAHVGVLNAACSHYS